MEDAKKPKVVFVPGCFDNFEGTQEELNDLMAEIHRMIESGELFEKSVPLDLDNLDEEDEELFAKILQSENTSTRLLQ